MLPPNNSAGSPQYFHAPHQRFEMSYLFIYFWSSLHLGQEIDHLGSDDLFSLVFTSLHFTVLGKIWATARGCQTVKFAKLVNFAESSPQCST